MCVIKKLCLVFTLIHLCNGQFRVPEVTLEAYEPTGFKASIKAEPDIELFAFHGKINKEIDQIEPGEFGEDVKIPVNGYFSYYNPNLKLNIEDVVNYWVFVQHKQLGYRRDGQKWTVTELRAVPGAGCKSSITKISDRTDVCINSTLLEEPFKGDKLDVNKWLVEQYISDAPDYEFVVYKNDPEVVFVANGQLSIKPKLQNEKDMFSETLDVSSGCTKPDLKGRQCIREKFLIHNPVISGRVVSKAKFSYGDIEIRAKLPSGDWIYPEIYLEDDQNRKLVIATARGNKVLTGKAGDDIGGSLLFGGPILSHREPHRSEHLSSYRSPSGVFSDTFHVYRLRWTPTQIELYLDGRNYGLIKSQSLISSGFTGDNPEQVRLVLGVGVGGLTNFPDGYASGVHDKPWKNGARTQVKTFYESKDEWFGTWTSGSQLQVDYIKITSL